MPLLALSSFALRADMPAASAQTASLRPYVFPSDGASSSLACNAMITLAGSVQNTFFVPAAKFTTASALDDCRTVSRTRGVATDRCPVPTSQEPFGAPVGPSVDSMQ